MTPEQRHRNMAAIRSVNTKPELLVRRHLWRLGFRYSLNSGRLPGHPDIVLRKYRTCIFVNGCFWHGHDGCRYFIWPKNNAEFWKAKISGNIQRDAQCIHLLKDLGWNVLVVWECELKKANREATLIGLETRLKQILLDAQERDHDE